MRNTTTVPRGEQNAPKLALAREGQCLLVEPLLYGDTLYVGILMKGKIMVQRQGVDVPLQRATQPPLEMGGHNTTNP